MSTYHTLTDFLTNAPDQLNALAPGGSHEVGFREKLFAGYIQDDWRARSNLTVNLGLRYEMTTRPTDANKVPGYTCRGLHGSHCGIPGNYQSVELHAEPHGLRTSGRRQSHPPQSDHQELRTAHRACMGSVQERQNRGAGGLWHVRRAAAALRVWIEHGRNRALSDHRSSQGSDAGIGNQSQRQFQSHSTSATALSTPTPSVPMFSTGISTSSGSLPRTSP